MFITNYSSIKIRKNGDDRAKTELTIYFVNFREIKINTLYICRVAQLFLIDKVALIYFNQHYVKWIQVILERSCV